MIIVLMYVIHIFKVVLLYEYCLNFVSQATDIDSGQNGNVCYKIEPGLGSELWVNFHNLMHIFSTNNFQNV